MQPAFSITQRKAGRLRPMPELRGGLLSQGPNLCPLRSLNLSLTVSAEHSICAKEMVTQRLSGNPIFSASSIAGRKFEACFLLM